MNSIELTNCKLLDENVKLLGKLFTPNLENLNLSNNNIQDIKIFFENDKLINLKKLKLNCNEFNNGLGLSNNKLSNLIELDLSSNKIENIDLIELDNLEELDLSKNLITKLFKINSKKIKNLNLIDNHLTDGINDFAQSIKDLSYELILEKLEDNSIALYYEKDLNVKFEYFLKDNTDITQFFKGFPFNGIKVLKIKGFNNNNIKFLSNNSLKDLQILDLKENSLNNISIFDNINFPDIKKILVSSNDFNDNSLNNLKNFPSIKVESITINLNRINIRYINPELKFNINNFNILYDNLGEIEKIEISKFPNNLDIFSYNSLSKKKLPIFQDIKVDNIDVNYKNGRYSCEMLFKSKKYNFTASYNFNNLNFMKSDEILSETNNIKFSNVILDQNFNFEEDIAYKNLEKLELNDCIIENISILEQIGNKINNNNLGVNANETKYKGTIYQNTDLFIIEYTKSKLSNEQTLFNCIKPFNFEIDIKSIDKYDLLKNAILTNIEILEFYDAGINNIDFLSNNTLLNLKKLYLNNNNIEDISIFDDDKIHFQKLEILNLKDNPIKKGLEVLKKNFFQKFPNVKLDLLLNELEIRAQFFNQENNLRYIIDIYINNLNEIPNLFQKDKVLFGALLSDAAEKFKEIFGFTSTEFEKKYQIYEPIKEKNYYEIKSIVIDNGSFYCKTGINGENDPVVFPSCVGQRNAKFALMVKHDKSEIQNEKLLMIGFDAKQKKLNYSSLYDIIYPIKNGIVNDWVNQEKIWEHIFYNELRVDPTEHNILISEVPMNPKENREKTAQIMFETFKVSGLYIANQSVLSLYSAGLYTGVSADLGGAVSHFVPVFDGYALQHATNRLYLGGKDLTEYMDKLSCQIYNGFNVYNGKNKLNFEDIKKKSCYVAQDFEEELKSVERFYYTLPDGGQICLKDERIRCPEALFKPSMIYKEGKGIAQACCDSILKADLDLRKDFYNHIVLSGGSSMIKGLPERFTKEIKYLAPESMKDEVKVIASSERKFAVWIGGSILSSLPIFESMVITKEEYEEYGAAIIHRKCF